MATHSILPPGGGVNYAWSMDHTFVKVSSEDTNGAYALMEDNLKAEFSLGLHEHREHAETFYILEGAVDFHFDGRWTTATGGTTIHIPPRVPHAVRMADGRPGKMLMIYQPAGFDRYLAALKAMTPEQSADGALQTRLAVEYDIHALGPVPD